MPENSTEIVTSAKAEKTSLAVTGVNTTTRPPLESAGFRIVLVSFLAGGIGLVAGFIAFLLYRLIGLFTNIAFYGKPVVERGDEGRIVGYLGRPGIMAARLRRMDEESVREPGWLKGFRGAVEH